MEVNLIQKKKHLLLLNRIMRAELKKDIIPTPSKLPEDEVNKYFKMLFIQKDGYYVPIKNKVSLEINEELFKDLIKKPKKPIEKKEVEKPIEKPIEKKKDEEELIKEYYNLFDSYNSEDFYRNIMEVYDKSLKPKEAMFFKNLKYMNRENENWTDNKANQKIMLNYLLTYKKLNEFLKLFKEDEEFDKQWEIENEKRNKQYEKDRQNALKDKKEVKPKEDMSNKVIKVMDKKARDNDLAEFLKGKIKFNKIN
jgi:hypothetical protein